MKTQTKTEIRNSVTKATKLLRGIDNEAAAIARDQAKLNQRVENVKKNVTVVASLLGGISDTALAAPTPAAKPAKKAAAKPAAKVAPKKAAKPSKAVAKATRTNKAAKPMVAKKAAAKPSHAKSGERPPLKSLINDVLDGVSNEWTPAAEIYKQVCAKAGYFSRQSLYNALKDEKSYEKHGDGAAAKFRRIKGASAKAALATKTTDEEADRFVEKATANPVAAAAT